MEAPIVREVREGATTEELDSAAASLPMRRGRRHHVLRCDSFRVKGMARMAELAAQALRSLEGALALAIARLTRWTRDNTLTTSTLPNASISSMLVDKGAADGRIGHKAHPCRKV